MDIKKKIKNVDYYLNLSWTYTIKTERDKKGKNFYIVSVNKLRGIATDASALQEAMELIKEVMATAFQMYLDNNEDIPEPQDFEQFIDIQLCD